MMNSVRVKDWEILAYIDRSNVQILSILECRYTVYFQSRQYAMFCVQFVQIFNVYH